MTPLEHILNDLDRRDLHGREADGARLYHLGLSDHLVTDVFAALAARERAAIRSGHIGGWEQIRLGQAGLVDYNRYICKDFALGVPVVHAHTFTENADLSEGDTIYLPAGRINQRAYERLPVYVKRADTLHPVDPGASVCAAFAYTDTGHGPAPLVQTRAAELAAFPGATTIPTVLCREEDLLRRALHALLARASAGASGLRLDDVLGSSVSRQGQRGEAPMLTEEGLFVNGTRYGSREALIDAAIQGLLFGSLEPGEVHASEAREDEYLPLLGATGILALLAYLDCSQAGADTVHTHWGAVSMSGYPPLSGGYFGRRATRRALRRLGEALSTLPEFAFDLRFVMLPAALLSLLPPAEFDTDAALVDHLMTTVATTEPPGADLSRAVLEITDIVRRWLRDHGKILTPYYLNRFAGTRSVLNASAEPPTDGTPHGISLFGSLTMRQASILQGALVQEAKQLVL